jgi:hypothetical protein
MAFKDRRMFTHMVVRWPEGSEKKWPRSTWTEPKGHFGAYRIEDDGKGPPSLLFFEYKEHADKAMEVLAQQWPGECFCVAQIETGAMSTPGPVQMISISDKGILPK